MKNIEIFRCPKCQGKVSVEGKSVVCGAGHSFDISKGGYVNLLLVDSKNSKNPGDNKLMASARRDFLNLGYYEPLAKAILEEVRAGVVLDCGCGTGYYLDYLQKMMPNLTCFGADISKDAVNIACRLNKEINWFVASLFKLPIEDNSADIILNVFAPKAQDEFFRVLKSGGKIIEVVPGENHLFELKSLMFQQGVRRNKEKFALTKFGLQKSKSVKYCIDISKTEVENLIKMTPYFYTTSKQDLSKLEAIASINVTLDFIVNVWEKF